jgi:hypothetical protein
VHLKHFFFLREGETVAPLRERRNANEEAINVFFFLFNIAPVPLLTPRRMGRKDASAHREIQQTFG